MNKFDEKFKMIMEDISSAKIPFDNSMRFANKRETYIKQFQNKLLELGQRKYLTLLFKEIKNLNQLNLNDQQIKKLSDNVMKFIYDKFYHNYSSYPYLNNYIMKAIKYKWRIQAVINAIARKQNIKKNLIDILNSTLQLNQTLKNVVIVKQRK